MSSANDWGFIGHALPGWWCPGPQPQPGHQVELPLLTRRRGQEQLLIQPVNLVELEPLCPGGEKAKEDRVDEQ